MKNNIPAGLIDKINLAKLTALNSQPVLDIVAEYGALCRPEKITVIDGSIKDLGYVKKQSLLNGEETPLATADHTYHFDGLLDQGRDKAVTKVLLPKGKRLGQHINTGERKECLSEIREKLKNIMAGKEMFVAFFTLGPSSSRFSIGAMQLSDSAYVIHSESILYRNGYEQFKALKGANSFFHFVHSAGELGKNKTSVNTAAKRIYIDLEANRVFSVNTQYAGNSLGLKKLALRLAIKKSHAEDWLCEHMFVMGVKPVNKNRTTYFTGAFPSACGKTSTAMIPGQTIIGDDIAYLKIGADGLAYATNVEQGIFGIIEDVNPIDDPLIYETLTTPREVIFSNILVNSGEPYWLGMGRDLPNSGVNYTGHWGAGQTDAHGVPIKPAHVNARYTIRIKDLSNVDPNLDNPEGVPLSGIIYGGRDYDVSPPVVEALSWAHGVFIGAILESVTTGAVVGSVGEMAHNPMANIDFMVVPLGTYLKNHLKFGDKLARQPKIFSTNYFLKDNGRFLNQKVDKKVWILWMEGRIHGEFSALETPIGFIPKYNDLKDLFWQIFSRDYTRDEYIKGFSLRTTALLERLKRVEAIYKKELAVPRDLFSHLHEQRQRLLTVQKTKGELVSPFDFEE